MADTFIRHLEPYGYVDQNKCDTETSEETTCKCPCECLRDFKNRQCIINKEFCKSIEEHEERITSIEQWDEQTEEKINGLNDDILNLSSRLDKDESAMTESGEEIEHIQQDLSNLESAVYAHGVAIEAIENELNDCLRKEEASELYYEKTYIDSKFSAVTDELIALDGKIDDETARAMRVEDDLYELIGTESGRAISAETILDGKIDSTKEELINQIDYVNHSLSQEIREEENRAIAAEAAISGDVVAKYEDAKRSILEVNENVAQIHEEVVSLDSAKASKEELANEASIREENDNNILNLVQSNTDRISSLEDECEQININVADVSSKTDTMQSEIEAVSSKTISDKQDLIGHSGDATTMDTIWAAKNLATALSTNALNAANAYTDEKIGQAKTELTSYVDQGLSKKADASAVTDMISDVYDRIANEVNTLNNNFSGEIADLKSDLAERDAALLALINSISDKLDKLYVIVENLTSYNGTGVYDLTTDTGKAIGGLYNLINQ